MKNVISMTHEFLIAIYAFGEEKINITEQNFVFLCLHHSTYKYHSAAMLLFQITLLM